VTASSAANVISRYAQNDAIAAVINDAAIARALTTRQPTAITM
jgi:hypothetical protein